MADDHMDGGFKTIVIDGQRFSIPDLPPPVVRGEVDHPTHYTSHPSGVECIQVTEHMNFNLGNAVKYIWRASLKGKQKQDLEKAIWYLQRELGRLK